MMERGRVEHEAGSAAGHGLRSSEGVSVLAGEAMVWPNMAATAILTAFALFKMGALLVGNRPTGMLSTVFPFLTEEAVHLLGLGLELSVALVCWKYRGSRAASSALLVLVGVMAWNRWARWFTGGVGGCGCTGVVAAVLHLNDLEESVVSLSVLFVLLGLALLAWPVRLHARLQTEKRVILWTLALVTCGGPTELAATPAIYLRGGYRVARYNPRTRLEYTNHSFTATFAATVCGSSWQVSSTNLECGAWAYVARDGTNTYTLTPDYTSASNTSLEPRPATDRLIATVSESPLYVAKSMDLSDVFVPWLTYCFSPAALHLDAKSSIEIPLPWRQSRLSLHTYGFRWFVKASRDGRFVETFRVERDTSLDLSKKKELLRQDVEYPTSVESYNAYMSDLFFRKTWTNRFVTARYHCTSWCETNGFQIPMASRLCIYGFPDCEPYYVADLAVASLSVGDDEPVRVPPAEARTLVYDYRYKQANRKRIFNCATYELQPGELWKTANDPSCQAQAAGHLAHGPKYPHYGWGKQVVAWLILGVVIVAPLLASRWARAKHKPTEKNENSK